MKISEAEINHSLLLYYELRRMTSIKGSDNSILYNFIEDFSYLKDGNSSIFSVKTIVQLNAFLVELKLYLETSKVARIWSLKLIDKRYLGILNDLLPELLKSISDDFESLNIDHEKNLDLQIEKLDSEYIVNAIETCC